MRLVVDTSVLVGELLRRTGRGRLGDERLELFLPEQMSAEAQVRCRGASLRSFAAAVLPPTSAWSLRGCASMRSRPTS
jgi:hypothetical protein